MKKKIIIIVCSIVFVLLAAVSGWILYNRFFPEEYKVGEDEIALRIQMDTKEDIGLLVYDYNIAGHDCGGGISNPDRSMIKHDEELIATWDKEQLKLATGCEDFEDELPINMRFRIITEYQDPNFDNVYPESITSYLEPIEWTAHIGQEYKVRITGDEAKGYVVSSA